mgnify:CR=1 FL=1
MIDKKFLSDSKNQWIAILLIGVILFAGVAYLNKKELSDFKKDIEEDEKNSPWLWCLDSGGYGVSGKTQWSQEGFKATCESDIWDMNCTWINTTGNVGCKCGGIR